MINSIHLTVQDDFVHLEPPCTYNILKRKEKVKKNE